MLLSITRVEVAWGAALSMLAGADIAEVLIDIDLATDTRRRIIL